MRSIIASGETNVELNRYFRRALTSAFSRAAASGSNCGRNADIGYSHEETTGWRYVPAIFGFSQAKHCWTRLPVALIAEEQVRFRGGRKCLGSGHGMTKSVTHPSGALDLFRACPALQYV